MTKSYRRFLLYAILISIILFSIRIILISIHDYQAQNSTMSLIQPVTQSGKAFVHATNLKVGPALNLPAKKEIILNEPIELDYKSRDEIMNIRTQYVNQYRELIEEEYVPFTPVFGAIEDNRPWWGIDGEFCYGPGNRSIDGPSEETRFFANPFLLLGLDENKAFILASGLPCEPAFPRPVTLYWYSPEAKAEVTYDISRFFRERERLPQELGNYHELSLVNYNARDFGYSYVYAARSLSKGVMEGTGARLFSSSCQLQSFIHRGGSCGYPGGCNNESPNQPDSRFKITDLPAVLYCKLWKAKPQNVEASADFIFIIKLQ